MCNLYIVDDVIQLEFSYSETHVHLESYVLDVIELHCALLLDGFDHLLDDLDRSNHLD
jgi:hypothetical protein